MDHGNSSTDGDGSNRAEIAETRINVESNGSSSVKSVFEPQESSEPNSMPRRPASPASTAVPAPEKKLTLFALRLAVLEKVASNLGTLGFIWATVVLLGGFAIAIDTTDFWFVSIILVIEGTRIFSRSHELELQHQTTWTIMDVGISSFRTLVSSSRLLVKQVRKFFCPFQNRVGRNSSRQTQETTGEEKKSLRQLMPTRTWKSSEVPLLPYTGWVFLSRNVSKLFYWLQLLSAAVCIALSLFKLIKQNYGEDIQTKPEKKNLPSALTIFYSLAFAEAFLFFVEKAYWEWTVSVYKILEKVNEECGFEKFGMVSIRRFFYEAYSRCVNGSIFDGLKMDMVTFAMELLESSFQDEQLMGARILCRFSVHEHYSNDTLQKLGMNSEIIERLLEMLNWKNLQQEEIRLSAAEILSRLAGKKQNSLRVSGISGAMESISSLLTNTRSFSDATDEIGEKRISHGNRSYDLWTFNNLGLVILKRLARDHDNCDKIGNTRGLLPRIIDFTYAEEKLLKNENAAESQILAVRRSLKLIRMLVSSTGNTGKNLRRDISEIVFTVSNIREILRHGERHPILQKLGIEILTFLAMDDAAREKIGGTGGILKELLKIFLKEEIPKNQSRVRVSAGAALAMLAQGSQKNCLCILKSNALRWLVEALDKPLVCVNAARILRNLCAHTAPQFHHQLEEVKSAGVTVLRAVKSEGDKLQEAMVGLAMYIFKLMSPEESTIMFKRDGIDEKDLAEELVQILKKYKQPTAKVPRIRRFVIELAIQMMEANAETVKTFRDLGMNNRLETVFETTTELENFDSFSGTVGVARQGSTINELIETALKLLEARSNNPSL